MTTAVQAANIADLLPEGSHLIGGQFIPGRSGETLPVLDPATGETLAEVPRGRTDDVAAAMAAAKAAAPEWGAMSASVRAHLLWNWGDLLIEHAQEIATLESMEVGKPVRDSYQATMGLAYHLHYMAGAADKLFGATLPTTKPEVLALTLREPYGVCGAIVPWNVPGYLMMRAVSPALAAGNAMVVKAAEDAPLACLYIAKLGLEAGVPPGVLNVITGYGPEAGAALASHPDLGHMSFTGSPETGTSVMKACAEHHVPLHLELGGKSPQIVLGDADLQRAIPLIVGYLVNNAGQMCFAGTRLLVEERMKGELVAALTQAFEGVRVGAWHEDQVDMGPLINAEQEARVLGYIQAGREEGARLAIGGEKLSDDRHANGFFVKPTLFDEVDPQMRIAQEEIFGPVLSVIAFQDPEQAVEIANATPYGLAASVWTNDLKRAVRLARGIEAGQVYVNTYFALDAIGAPFGGYKRSGFGRTQGYETILEYTRLKTVIVDAQG